MNKVITGAALISVGVLGYTLGLSHSHDEHQHNESAVAITNVETKFEDSTLSSPESSHSSEQKISSSTNTQTVEDHNATTLPTDIENNEEVSLETLIAQNPNFFEGEYAEIAREDGNYPRAIHKFSNENGISSWGIQREQDTAKLLQTDQLKSVHVSEFECRIKTCLIRGTAASKGKAQRIFEDYQNVQQWGLHFGGHEDKSGQYVFYLASFKQEK